MDGTYFYVVASKIGGKDTMNKIAILSMQRVVNFGSVLQGYSLRKMIYENTGALADFLDIDRENTIECNHLMSPRIDSAKELIMPMGLVHRAKRKLVWQLVKHNDNQIKEFMKNELEVAEENSNKEYDCVVVGSDEVFNNPLGICIQLYGDVKQADKVISYAASCGAAKVEEIPEESVDTVKSAMKNFKAMSVRDDGTKEYVKKLYDGVVEKHLDPVLMGDLHKREHKKVPLKNYIVVYGYSYRMRDKAEIDAIKKFAKERGLKTVSIGGTQFWTDYYIPMSPFRVLDYFYYADYVITDTFHGTIFSVINQKKFASIIRKSNENKMTNLLKDLGLEERRVDDVNRLSEILEQEIDYDSVNKLLEEERVKAREYLKRNLVEE